MSDGEFPVLAQAGPIPDVHEVCNGVGQTYQQTCLPIGRAEQCSAIIQVVRRLIASVPMHKYAAGRKRY